jgi:hypothetical protein
VAHKAQKEQLFNAAITGSPSRATITAPSGGQKRITDRFVKYPYPKNVSSNYQKEFIKKKVDKKEGQ